VQWYGRVPGDEERLVFRMGGPCVDFVNSTELRHVLTDSSVTSQRTRRSEGDKWVLDRSAEAEARSWCR